MDELLDVVKVAPGSGQTLYLEFENGERRVIDLSPFLERPPFQPLKALPLFRRAFVDYGTVVWPGEIDIAPETLYDRSQPVPPEEWSRSLA
jgi:hypothetical protein